MRYSALAYGVDPSPALSFRKAFSVTLGFAALVLTTLTVTWAIYTYVGGLSLTRTTRPSFDTTIVAFTDRFITRSDDTTGSLPSPGKFEVASADSAIVIPDEPDAAPLPAKPVQAASIPLPPTRPPGLRERMKDSIVRKEIALANKAATLTASAKSVFDRLFRKPDAGPTLAYAGSDGGILTGNAIDKGEISLKPPFNRDTAVYDITAKKVY
ncbi:MAG: hypothetical protein NTZ72_03705, partial [Afipia sp.]|nr:hypothetical protein [Afipia sp.]